MGLPAARIAGLVSLTAVSALLAGCGAGSTSASAPAGAPRTTTASQAPSPNATESNPPGDIPDNQVFVDYRPAGASFSVQVPEGWARSAAAGAVTFTDKLNSIRIESAPAGTAPTAASARQSELPAVAAATPKYRLVGVTTVSRKPGAGVLIRYLADSAPDPVTNKVVRDAVERYEFWHAGQEVVLTLSGPEGADNVDPWRIVTDSLTWR